MTRRNIERKLAIELGTTPKRGDTWVGIRPAVMKNKKYDKKAIRREGRNTCAAY